MHEDAIEGLIPANLSGLGRQLSKDADRLAGAFPSEIPGRLLDALDRPEIAALLSESPPRDRSRHAGSNRRRLVWLAASVALVTTGVVAWSTADSWQAPSDAPLLAGPAVNNEVITESPSRDSLAQRNSETHLPLIPAADQRAAETLLRNVSGPELEALLDLWEQTDVGKSLVSI